MKHLQKPPRLALMRNKRFWLIAGPILLAMVLIGLGAFSIANAKQQYSQAQLAWLNKYAEAKATAKQQLDDSQKDGRNLDKVLASLKQLQSSLEAWQPPAQPTVLGVVVGNKKAVEAQKVALENRDKVVDELKKAQIILEYQPQVSAIITALSGKSTKNLDELKALAADWQTKSDQLAGITPPEEVKTVHASMQTAVSEGAKTLQAMVPLYEKQDVAGFNAKRPELADKINLLQTQAKELEAQFAAQDAKLQTHLHELDHTTEAISSIK